MTAASERTAGPSTSRMEAFSDGVLAIAITLLVLEIHSPVVKQGESLAHALGHLWPKYAAFVVSFVTIGIMWINHHALFDRVARVDRALLFVNLLLLMSISFLPFPTAVLGDYIRDADQGRVAAVLYGANMTIIGLGFLALWWYLLRHAELRGPEFSDVAVREGLRRTIIGPVAYALSIVVALVSPPAALVVWGALAGYFAVGRVGRSQASSR